MNFDKTIDDTDAAMVLDFIATGREFYPDDAVKNSSAIDAANVSGADIDVLDVIWILNHKTVN